MVNDSWSDVSLEQNAPLEMAASEESDRTALDGLADGGMGGCDSGGAGVQPANKFAAHGFDVVDQCIGKRNRFGYPRMGAVDGGFWFGDHVDGIELAAG